MDTFAVRLKWYGNPVAIVFRIDKDFYKGPCRIGWLHPHLKDGEKADRLLIWVNNCWDYATSKDIW
jgi:hypothetical protein